MFPRLRAWFRNLLRRPTVDAALDEELRACVDIMTAERVRAGVSPAEARQQVFRETGGVDLLKAHVRETRAGASAEAVFRDVRYAVRSLAGRRLFALTAALSLAIGIGASTAAYSWGRNMLFSDPSGVGDPATLVALYVDDHDPTTDYNIVSPAHFAEIERAATSVFERMGGANRFWATLGAGGTMRAATVEYVTSGFFDTVRPPLALGRGIATPDNVPGAALTAVISDTTWRTLFAASNDVLSQTLRLNGKVFDIVGVTGPAFVGVDYGFYGRPDVWAASQAQAAVTGRAPSIRSSSLRVTARLRPGVTQAIAANALAPIAQTLSYQPTDSRHYDAAVLVPVREARIPLYTRVELRQYFSVLLAVAGLILAAACVNIANFLLSQGVVRRNEMAVRLALGATRRQLLQQLLTEGAVLGAIGAAGGGALAVFFATLLERFPLVTNLGTTLQTPVTIDLHAAAFIVGVTVLATLTFGLLPALIVSARAPVTSRVDLGARGSHRGFTSRQVVLALQVAVSILLSIVAGLYARSLLRIESLRYPYPASILLARINPSAMPVEQRKSLYLEALREVRARAEVVSAGFSYNPVMSIGAARVTTAPGAPVVQADYTSIGPGFLQTLGLPIRAGRDFREDEDETSHVAIVNTTLADRLWPGETVVGRTVRFPGLAPPDQPFTIVGVVDQPRCQDQQPQATPCVYWPPNYVRYPTFTLHIQTKGAPVAFAPIVRQLVHDLNPDAFVEQTLTLRDEIGIIRMGPRVATVITAGMAVIASLLGAIGCAALLLALVREAQREIAIRLALGSTTGQLTRHIMSRALWPYTTGLALGLLGAWYGATRLNDQLYETSIHDPGAFVIPVLVLLVLGLVASFVPTRSATRMSPANLLRN